MEQFLIKKFIFLAIFTLGALAPAYSMNWISQGISAVQSLNSAQKQQLTVLGGLALGIGGFVAVQKWWPTITQQSQTSPIFSQRLMSGSCIDQYAVLSQCGTNGFGGDSCGYHALKNGFITALYGNHKSKLTTILGDQVHNFSLNALLNDVTIAGNFLACKEESLTDGCLRAVARAVREKSVVKNHCIKLFKTIEDKNEAIQSFYFSRIGDLTKQIAEDFEKSEKINLKHDVIIKKMQKLIAKTVINDEGLASYKSLQDEGQKLSSEAVKEKLKEKIEEYYIIPEEITINNKDKFSAIMNSYVTTVLKRDTGYIPIFAKINDLLSHELEIIVQKLQEVFFVQDIIAAKVIENESFSAEEKQLRLPEIAEIKNLIDSQKKIGLFIVGTRSQNSQSGHWISLVIKKQQEHGYHYILTNSQNNESVGSNDLVNEIIDVFEKPEPGQLTIQKYIDTTFVKTICSRRLDRNETIQELLIKEYVNDQAQTDLGSSDLHKKIQNHLKNQSASVIINQRITKKVPGFYNCYFWEYADKDRPISYEIVGYKATSEVTGLGNSEKGKEIVEDDETISAGSFTQLASVVIPGGRPQFTLTSRGKIGLWTSFGALALGSAYKLYSWLKK